VLYVGGNGIGITIEDKLREITVDRELRPGPIAIVLRLIGKNELIDEMPGPSEIVEKPVLSVPSKELMPGPVIFVLVTNPLAFE
jgi:hypothetical protein